MSDCFSLKIWMKIGALGALDAVGRPGPSSLLERNVVGGVPVLRRYDQRELGNKPINDGHDLVSFVHGKRALRAKVILNIDEDQCGVLELGLHCRSSWVHSSQGLNVG